MRLYLFGLLAQLIWLNGCKTTDSRAKTADNSGSRPPVATTITNWCSPVKSLDPSVVQQVADALEGGQVVLGSREALDYYNFTGTAVSDLIHPKKLERNSAYIVFVCYEFAVLTNFIEYFTQGGTLKYLGNPVLSTNG